MKKLATALAAASALTLAAPAFACPGMDHDAAPRTADKAEAPKGTQTAGKQDGKAADKPVAKPEGKADGKADAKAAPKKDKISMK